MCNPPTTLAPTNTPMEQADLQTIFVLVVASAALFVILKQGKRPPAWVDDATRHLLILGALNWAITGVRSIMMYSDPEAEPVYIPDLVGLVLKAADIDTDKTRRGRVQRGRRPARFLAM